MNKQDRDNYVAVTTIQTLLKSVETYIKADGGVVPEVNGLSGEPLYDALNLIANKSLNTPYFERPNKGHQNTLLELQTWYNFFCNFVNENRNVNFRSMDIDGYWSQHVYLCFNTLVQEYRKHHTSKQAISETQIRRRNYLAKELEQVVFKTETQLTEFHKLAEIASGVTNIADYLPAMRAVGWKFVVSCEEDGFPVAVIAYQLPSTLTGNRKTIIGGLYVNDLHRGRSIGKTLVNEVIHVSSQYGYDVTANDAVKHVRGWPDLLEYLGKFNVHI